MTHHDEPSSIPRLVPSFLSLFTHRNSNRFTHAHRMLESKRKPPRSALSAEKASPRTATRRCSDCNRTCNERTKTQPEEMGPQFTRYAHRPWRGIYLVARTGFSPPHSLALPWDRPSQSARVKGT